MGYFLDDNPCFVGIFDVVVLVRAIFNVKNKVHPVFLELHLEVEVIFGGYFLMHIHQQPLIFRMKWLFLPLNLVGCVFLGPMEVIF